MWLCRQMYLFCEMIAQVDKIIYVCINSFSRKLSKAHEFHSKYNRFFNDTFSTAVII
jgi:hypothetical protein